MLSVLQECSDTLAVYQYTLKKPSMRADIDIDCIPEVSRIKNPTNSNKIQTWDQQAEYVDIQDSFEKLLRDSENIGRLMEDAVEDVRAQGCLDALPRRIYELSDQKRHDDELISKAEWIATSIRKLKCATEKEEKEFREQVEEMNVRLFDAKNRRAKLETTASIESRYVNAWEESRRAENSLERSCRLERRSLYLNRCFIRQKNKDRVASTVEAFLRQSARRSEEQAKYWSERYEKELSIYENDIQSLREKISVERQNLQTLKSECESRQNFIDSYLLELEIAKRQRDHEAHMQKSAIKIQAWWRGVMVRRKLGPYRPEEKKKKRAAKAKK